MENTEFKQEAETELLENNTAILQPKGVGTIWLELLETTCSGMLPRVDLDFRKTNIIMGRLSSDEPKPDVLFPRELKKIGRRHVRIECRDSGYYVVDLGSINHTLLDDEVLVPNQPYLLKDGMELAFTTRKIVRYRVHL